MSGSRPADAGATAHTVPVREARRRPARAALPSEGGSSSSRPGPPCTRRASPPPASSSCSRAPSCSAALLAGDDVEISRTYQRGVYAGAMQAYLGDRVDAALQQLPAGRQPTPSSSSCPPRSSPPSCATWFPMAVHLLEGLFFGTQNAQRDHRPAGTAARARLAVRGLTHELNNPAAAAVTGHRRAARPGGRDAAQTRHDRGRPGGRQPPPRTRGAAGRRGQTGRGAPRRCPRSRPPTREDELGDWLDDHGSRGRLGPRADLGGRRSRSADGWTRSPHRRRGVPRLGGPLAQLHHRHRIADGRDRRLHDPDLESGGRGQAVLPAGPAPHATGRMCTTCSTPR